MGDRWTTTATITVDEERKGVRKQPESGVMYRVSRMTASIVLAVGISVGTVGAADNAVEKSPAAGATTKTLKPPGGREEPVPAAAYTHRPGADTAALHVKRETTQHQGDKR